MSTSKCDELLKKAMQADEEEKKYLSIQQELQREYDNSYPDSKARNEIKKKLDSNRPKLAAAMKKETEARHKHNDCLRKESGH
jgi:hypothetical protein